VQIDRDALVEYAAGLPDEACAPPELDAEHHFLADRAGTVGYFLVLDTINFGSGYWPALRKRPGLSGYFTIATSLKEAFEREGPWDAETLANMSVARCAATFGQPPEFPLMPRYVAALNELGRFLLADYGGEPLNLLESISRSAETLADRLAALRCYQDVATYHGERVAFYKRAQLATADLDIALATISEESDGRRGSGKGFHFHDLDRLTIFADNLVPHVLRLDGVLHFAPQLVERIEAEALIPAGSAEEVEIRACAVHAVELIKAELVARGRQVTAHQLDYWLWNRGQESRYKSRPRHRTRSDFY
jgi:Potential Queuosine, Q, salvage protein family